MSVEWNCHGKADEDDESSGNRMSNQGFYSYRDSF